MNKYPQILLYITITFLCITTCTPLAAMQQPERLCSNQDLFLAVRQGDLKKIIHASKAPQKMRPDFNAVSPKTKLTALGTACHILCDLLSERPPFDEIKNDPLASRTIAMKNLRYPQGIKPFIGMILYLSFSTAPPSTNEEDEARMQVLDLIHKDWSDALAIVNAICASYGKRDELSLALETMLGLGSTFVAI